MFKGKESSNRIELSQLVQELLNFGVFSFLQLLGVGGGWGCPPHTCMCMHTHAHTCMRGKHDNFMQMAAPIGGIPGNSMMSYVCACMCMWVGCTLSPPPNHIHPPPHPPGDPQNHSKFNSTWN